MSLLYKVRKFFALDAGTMLLLTEAFCYLAAAKLFMYVPFAKLAPRLGTHMSETLMDQDRSRRQTVLAIASSIAVMSRHTFWKSTCFVRAVAALMMLKRRGISSTLYFGTGKDEEGRMAAHAWLRSGPYYVTGADEMSRFTPVSMFACTPKKEERRESQ